MKAYIDNVCWADEGDIFFFSVASEERVQALKELLVLYKKFDLFPTEVEMWWGTNESFTFNIDELIDFIDDVCDITKEELDVFEKFGINGFDIFDRIETELCDCTIQHNWRTGNYYINENITQEVLDQIKPNFVKIFNQKNWDKVIYYFNKREV